MWILMILCLVNMNRNRFIFSIFCVDMNDVQNHDKWIINSKKLCFSYWTAGKTCYAHPRGWLHRFFFSLERTLEKFWLVQQKVWLLSSTFKLGKFSEVKSFMQQVPGPTVYKTCLNKHVHIGQQFIWSTWWVGPWSCSEYGTCTHITRLFNNICF